MGRTRRDCYLMRVSLVSYSGVGRALSHRSHEMIIYIQLNEEPLHVDNISPDLFNHLVGYGGAAWSSLRGGRLHDHQLLGTQ